MIPSAIQVILLAIYDLLTHTVVLIVAIKRQRVKTEADSVAAFNLVHPLCIPALSAVFKKSCNRIRLIIDGEEVQAQRS